MPENKERIIIEIDEDDGIITNVYSTNLNISVSVLHRVPEYEWDFEDWKEEMELLDQEIEEKGMVDIY